MMRFALLLSLLALGALGLVACDDDDQTATAETEVITSNFGQDPPGRSPVVAAGGRNACADYRRGPGDILVRDRRAQRCRSLSRGAARTEERLPGHDRDTPPWSCQDYGEVLVECEDAGGRSVRRKPLLQRPDPGGSRCLPRVLTTVSGCSQRPRSRGAAGVGDVAAERRRSGVVLEEPADLLVRPLEGRAVLDAQGGADHEREQREGYEVDKDEAHLHQMMLAGCRTTVTSVTGHVGGGSARRSPLAERRSNGAGPH